MPEHRADMRQPFMTERNIVVVVHPSIPSIHSSIHPSIPYISTSIAPSRQYPCCVISGPASRCFAAALFLRTVRESNEPRGPGGEKRRSIAISRRPGEVFQAPFNPVKDPGWDSRSTSSPSPSLPSRLARRHNALRHHRG
jgi:hypothetical protein